MRRESTTDRDLPGLAAAKRSGRAARLVVIGGGVAGLEAVLGLRRIGGDRLDLTLISPRAEFIYKPWTVEEPFTLRPPGRHDLEAISAEVGFRFMHSGVSRLKALDHAIELSDGTRLAYDAAFVCLGARPRDAYESALTYRIVGDPVRIEELMPPEPGGSVDGSWRIAFVVPPGPTWPLPAYELALLTRHRLERRGLRGTELVIVTAESRPLEVFGDRASEAVATLLEARSIETELGRNLVERAAGSLMLEPGGGALEADRVLAMPRLEGPAPIGLPMDASGFVPIDEHCRVPGLDDVYAAGDGTSFPVKQGGIAAQQADAAIEHAAAALGLVGKAAAFAPVLRGKLLTGDETLSMSRDLGSGDSEGTVSLDALWWPPHKIAGRYLSAWLDGAPPREPEDLPTPLDVEGPRPSPWRSQPMQMPMDAYRGD